jgi:hypothetical protein
LRRQANVVESEIARNDAAPAGRAKFNHSVNVKRKT